MSALSKVETDLAVTERMGFRIIREKSFLTPVQRLSWLGMLWDSRSGSVRISEQNATKIHHRLLRASLSHTLTRRQWDSLLGSFNFAAEVTPRGRLKFRRLFKVVNAAVPVKPRDLLKLSLLRLFRC